MSVKTVYNNNLQELLLSDRRVQVAKAGNLFFTSGQSALTETGQAMFVNDTQTEIQVVVSRLNAVLQSAGSSIFDLVKLIAFFVPDQACNELSFTELLGRHLAADASIAICVVPVTSLPVPGTRVQIQAIAAPSHIGRTVASLADLPTLPRPFVHGVRCGEMIFPSAQSARLRDGTIGFEGDIVAQSGLAMDRLERVLIDLGAGLDDVVKQNRWASGDPSEEAWKPAALKVANRYTEPGPVATGIDIPDAVADNVLIKIDLIAMRGQDNQRLVRKHAWPPGHWDWPIHLTYKHGCRCGDLVFVGGQVSWDPNSKIIDPGSMILQTRRTMENISRILAELGAGMDDVVSITSFYNPTKQPESTIDNWSTCLSAFSGDGPTFAGVPNLFPTYPEMLTEIEAIAYIGANTKRSYI